MGLGRAIYNSGKIVAAVGILYVAGDYIIGERPDPNNIMEIGEYVLYDVGVLARIGVVTTLGSISLLTIDRVRRQLPERGTESRPINLEKKVNLQ